MTDRIFIVTLFAVFSLMISGYAIPSAFATGMGVSMSAEVMPYDYVDNPILELNGNIISWVPYAENSKFDIIKDLILSKMERKSLKIPPKHLTK